MSYTTKPNTGTLFVNDRKQQETHPDYNGKLLISRDLLEKLATYGEAQIEISAWIKETKNGKQIISLQCKEPYKKDAPPQQYAPAVIHEPTAHRSGALVETDRGLAFTEYRQPAPVAPPAPQDAQRYLDKLKIKIAAIASYPDFEKLYENIHSPKIWEVFKSVPAIAQEASALLSAKKTELILAIAPVDLSAIISAIDVEISRLKLPAKEHCLARWKKPRAMLSAEELQEYLLELKAANPLSDDFF